jgi:hypothetical protein
MDDGILENVNCACKSGCSTRRCACQKAELKCTGLCSCCDCTNSPYQNTDLNYLSDDDAYYSNLMAMTLDSMAYLKNNDGNALRYYLRSAADQYLFIYSIFSFGSTVFIL